MKCVVLGSAGFVGKACVEELLSRGDTVTGVDRSMKKANVEDKQESANPLKFIEGNILDKTTLINAFEGADEIYLLAGQLGTAELESSMRLAIETNILGALTFLKLQLLAKCLRYFWHPNPAYG